MKHSCKEQYVTNMISKIIDYSTYKNNLDITQSHIEVDVLSRQLLDSIRRVEYFKKLQKSSISINRTNPNSNLFDPIRACYALQKNDFDEACWLAFLTVHFGENYNYKWKLTKNFYNNLNGTSIINWNTVVSNKNAVTDWVKRYKKHNTKFKFGNHRKYESINQLDQVINSYIDIILSKGGHKNLFLTNKNPKQQFEYLYNNMNIYRFGRLAKFDYLCFLSKTNLANIEPNSCYLAQSTGPLRGAKLLFGSNLNNKEIEEIAIDFADYIGVGYQELEDAMCNWQKSTFRYIKFNG